MRKTPPFVTWSFLTAAFIVAPAAHSQEIDNGDHRRMSRLLVDYRNPEQTAQQRTKITLELVAIGDQSVNELRELIDERLLFASRQIDQAFQDGSAAREIEQSRETLERLRNDPRLSEAKLRRSGKAALERLMNRVPAQREQHTKSLTALTTMLQHLTLMRESFAQLEERWKDREPPLPADDYAHQIDVLIKKTQPPVPDERLAEVAKINAAVAGQLDNNVTEAVEALNFIRTVAGLDPLEIDMDLCKAARGHAADMRSLEFFSHESPVPGKKTFFDRATKAGTTASGENILVGATSGKQAIELWFYSPAHHKIMMGNHRRVGVGRVDKYWTLLVGQ